VANTDGSGTDELWTTGQAAAYLERWGISRRMVSQMVNDGVFGFRRDEGKWARVPRAAVEQYAAELEKRRASGGLDATVALVRPLYDEGLDQERIARRLGLPVSAVQRAVARIRDVRAAAPHPPGRDTE
jgi:excisionase family DNA binding protein